MRSEKVPQKALEDIKVNVKLKLAALWATVMLLYLYVDYFGFFKPGFIEDILAGKAFVFDITETFVQGGLILMTIPSLMVFLSVALPARANRWTNITVATVYIPVSIFNVIGGDWVFFLAFGAVVEVVLLSLAIRYAWKWPKQEA